MSWSEYEKWSFSLIKDVFAHLQFLINCILLSLNYRALEIGSGTGLQSCFVSYFGVEVVSIDRDPRVAKMACRISNYYHAKNLAFVVADARYLPFQQKAFRSSFSQGLLEHLDNGTIKKIVNEANSAVSGKMLFSVPSNNFPEQDFGNERLLSPQEWKVILASFDVKASYYLFDFQSFKNSRLNLKIPKPWHVLIKISSVNRTDN